jgi:uncharacterized tellurite resistance protein B-like protein
MDKKLIETLAKVIVAAGWADGKLSPKEINSLKDLLFQFQEYFLSSGDVKFGLTSNQWAMFEMYTEAPIDATERERLVNELGEAVWSEEDRTLVLSALQNMVEADDKITDEEQAILNGVKAKLESIDTGIIGDLGRLVREAMQRRSQAVSHAPNRERYFDDFLKNKIYYGIRRRLELDETIIEIPDEDLRKLSTVGGMMARVAQIDGVVIEKESDQITSILQTSWGLSHEAATFVIEVAMTEASTNFDYLRMTREFLEITTPAERANLVDVLHVVANADGKASDEELKEIRNIAEYLLVNTID